MTTLGTALAILVALALALALAFYPLRVLVDLIARNITTPIREYINRTRERRSAPRTTPDRRQGP